MSDKKLEMPRVGDPPEQVLAYERQEQAAARERERKAEVQWKVEALKNWQATDHVHPLTGGECPGKLEPLNKDNQVVLVCPDCGWSQPESAIPSVCFGPVPRLPQALAEAIEKGCEPPKDENL